MCFGCCCFVCNAENFKKLEKETGFPKAFFFVPAVVLLTVVMTVVGGFKLMVDLVGFLYPAYMSFKSMDSGSSKEETQTQWLTYWVVFSFFSIFESVFGFLVGFIPFYYAVKICVVIWCFHPSTMGAKVIYNQGLRPLLLPYIGVAGGETATKKTE